MICRDIAWLEDSETFAPRDYGIAAVKNLVEFIGKNLCWVLFVNNVPG